MNYRRDKKSFAWLNTLIAISLVILLVLVFRATSLGSLFAGGLHRIGEPVWVTGINLSERAGLVREASLKSKRMLVEENAELVNLLDEAHGRLLDLERLQTENNRFRDILRIPGRTEDVVNARVIATPRHSIYDSVVISAGADDGVRVGDRMVAFETVMLGEVTEVYSSTSLVQLYSQAGTAIDVYLPALDMVLETEGRGAGNFRLELPRDVEIEEGAQVLDRVTNRILATVQATLFDPREPFQTVLARSPVNTQHLDWVQVIGSDQVREIELLQEEVERGEVSEEE